MIGRYDDNAGVSIQLAWLAAVVRTATPQGVFRHPGVAQVLASDATLGYEEVFNVQVWRRDALARQQPLPSLM